MSVALSIVFTGLCAVVADGDRAPAEVLLVDASRVGEVGGVAIPAHAPTLVVSLDALANAASSGPTRVVLAGSGGGLSEQLGIWDLTGSEVRIRVQEGKTEGPAAARPHAASSWPEPPRDLDNPDAWRDLRFVPNMSRIVGDGRIDPALVAPVGLSNRLPGAVSARIHLEGGRLEAGMPTQHGHRADVFEFRGRGEAPKLRQAMTDVVRWGLETDAGAVVIEISPVDGGPARRLVLAPSATPHTLFVSNLPTENVVGGAHHAINDLHMGALHFGAYYKLLKNEPADEPVPTLASGARRGAGLMYPRICTPALFSRD
ncbi:MAG TPA: hypothetical protein VL691_02015 [Vicinamibacteria bacterium]|nr:hypothetical protein [Vicinamibacteria bacterium]